MDFYADLVAEKLDHNDSVDVEPDDCQNYLYRLLFSNCQQLFSRGWIESFVAAADNVQAVAFYKPLQIDVSTSSYWYSYYFCVLDYAFLHGFSLDFYS